MAIRDGRFVAVGSNLEMRRLIETWPKSASARHRRGRPHGRSRLIDSHVHALMVAAAEAKQPFAGLSSIAEIQDWIRKEAARVPAGTGSASPRIFPTRVREHRFPTRAELDAAAPDHPVAIDGAYAWMVNSGGAAGREYHVGHAQSAGRRDCRRTLPVSRRACSATWAICSRAFAAHPMMRCR